MNRWLHEFKSALRYYGTIFTAITVGLFAIFWPLAFFDSLSNVVFMLVFFWNLLLVLAVVEATLGYYENS